MRKSNPIIVLLCTFLSCICKDQKWSMCGSQFVSKKETLLFITLQPFVCSKASSNLFPKHKTNKLLWKTNIVKRQFLRRSHRKEIENIENIVQILWKGYVYCMLTLQLKKLKLFVISQWQLFIITSSCDRLRTGDDSLVCEFMSDNSSLTSYLVVMVSDIFLFV